MESTNTNSKAGMQEPELCKKCKQFFGNSQTGLCSKCFRESEPDVQRKSIPPIRSAIRQELQMTPKPNPMRSLLLPSQEEAKHLNSQNTRKQEKPSIPSVRINISILNLSLECVFNFV
jgi:hypothetical protein